MILSDTQIRQKIQTGEIVIQPFRPEALGSNSYDVHLGSTLAVYRTCVLDAKKPNPIQYLSIPPQGMVLQPHILYLGVTEEYTETHACVPFLEGKSSIGRLGIHIHATAGKGDVGFCNYWTLEITVAQPVRVYAGMPIGQLIFFSVEGPVKTPYTQKLTAKYTEKTPYPLPSLLWKHFQSDNL
ncbi:MAG: dCTP deaminase [Bacteroidia bacterium]